MASSSSGPVGLLAQASISPADGRLVFSLPAAASSSSSSSACTCALTITNTSSTTGPYLAFKIKTTKPKRYLVRPCQGVLRPGERQEVSVVIPSEGLGEVLRALGAEGDASSDKFQVDYAGIDEGAYWVVAGQGAEGSSNGQQHGQQQQQRLDRVWAKLDKRMVRERRLDVEFSRASQQQQQQQPSSSSLAPSVFVSSGPMTMAEYRKRYDDLVTVTVGLTAERDSLLNALDTLKFELRRELASERGQHVAAGGTVKQDQLSVHKRRRSKASSAAFMSSIPGIAAHAREPSSGLSLGPTGAGGRYHAKKRQQQQHHAPEKRRFSTRAVAAAAVVAFLIARWLT